MNNTVHDNQFIYEYVDHQLGEAHILRITRADTGYELQETISINTNTNPTPTTKEVIITDNKAIKEFFKKIKSMTRFWRRCYVSTAPGHMWYQNNYSWFIKCQSPKIEISGKDVKPKNYKEVETYICDFFTQEMKK